MFRRGFLHFSLIFINAAIIPTAGLAEDIHPVTKLRKHLVAYGAIEDSRVPYIAKHFEIIIISPRTVKQIRNIKQLNPKIIALMYRDIFAMHPYYEDWNEVNEHEEFFLHDEISGLRLKQNHYGWYAMDIGSKGWKEHYSNFVLKKMHDIKVFDGIFADDVWNDAYFHRFFIDIKNERNVVGSDGKIVVKYPVWKPKFPGRRNNISIRMKREPKASDFFANGSFSGRTISPGRSLTPGTVVYVSYSATDPKTIKPSADRIKNWKRHMVGMLKYVRRHMGNKLIIINTDDFSNEYLQYVDGMMCEGFGSTNPKYWDQQLRSLNSATKNGKRYLAQTNIKGDGSSREKSRRKIDFALNSYLLGEGPCSSFSLGMKDYATYYFKYPVIERLISDYERKHQLLGKSVGDYFIIAEGRSESEGAFDNLLNNYSFEEGLGGWRITSRCLGTPDISISFCEGRKSAHFVANGRTGSAIMSDFIPIFPNTSYELSVWVKGRGIGAGNPSWKRLCWIGRFYDADKKKIQDFAPDLQFGLGDYEWKKYRRTYRSPENARFYRITSLGLHKGSRGEGWIDKVRFRKNPKPFEYRVYARMFENGLLMVNVGAAECSISLNCLYFNASGERIDEITLNGHESAALYKRKPLQVR